MSKKAEIYLKNEEWKVKNLFKDFSYEKMAEIIQSYADQQTTPQQQTIEKLRELLRKAIEKETKRFNAVKQDTYWYNNNMPNVGQKLDYKSCPPKSDWLSEAEQFLNTTEPSEKKCSHETTKISDDGLYWVCADCNERQSD